MTDSKGNTNADFTVTQAHLRPLLASMHRLVSDDSGLLNVNHESVRRAVANRYFAFSQGRIRTLVPRLRKLAEDRRKSVHKKMGRYFSDMARNDDMSDLQELPRPLREKNYHKTLSGDPPSFRVVARVRPIILQEAVEGLSSVFVRVDRLMMCAERPQTKQPKVFTLDCCVAGREDQQTTWRRIAGDDLIEKALNGFNVTIMAYGQIGSGKTRRTLCLESLRLESLRTQACPSKSGMIARV